MLTVKQVFEFARDGAFEKYEFATKCKNFDAAHALAQITREIQNVIDNLDKKENYIASSNPGTETAVLFALNLKDGDVQKLKEAKRPQPAQLYQVRITHLTGDEQVLRFPILAAAGSTLELLKYELEVGRIRGAKIVRVIPSVGMKETLVSIGETEEEDIF
mgnify:FL=1